jgi:hypothetical protein
MGNKASKPKDLIPFDIRDEKNKFKLPNVLHLTAAKLISQAKFSDLEKLHDKKYCDEMIILTSKVLRHHLNSQEVLWLDRSLRDNNNEPIEIFKTEPLVHLDNQSVKYLDEQGKEKKQHMCTGIARYYIKIAHLFAAINKTVNPMISWKNSDGKQLTPVMNKSEVPKGVRTTLSKLNFCTQRIASIKPLHNTDKNILIKAKNCNMNIKTENIQTGGGDPVPTVTVPETEETGFFQGMVDGANNMLDNAINTSKDLISNTTEKTKEAFSNVTEKTKDVASNIMEKAENIKDTVPTENPVSNLMTDKELDSDTEETPTEENPLAETSTEEKPAEEQKVVYSPVLAEGEPPLEDKSQNNVVTEEAKQEMEKIQTAKKEQIKEENTAAVDNHKKTVTKALTDEIGIPELEALYFDVYNFKKGVFDQKSKESEGQYNKDVATFYKTFSLSEKVPPEIKKFSDIKLKDFHNQPLCNDKNSPWAKSYHSNPNHKDFELFKTYAKHITDMTFKNKQNEQKLVTIVDQIFAYWIDPETKVKQLTIDPQLTYEKLDKLIPETRDIIVQLYVECEKDFQEGLNILEAIIKKRMLVNAENRVERFQKKRDAMLENDMLQETEPTPSPDAVGASDVKIETEEEKELMQDEENKEEKKEKYNPVVDATEVTVNDKPVIEEPKPHEEAPKPDDEAPEPVENAPIPDQVVGNA